MHSRIRPGVLVAGLAALLLLPRGPAAGAASPDDSAVVAPGASRVVLEATDIGGFDYLEVTAGADRPGIEGAGLDTSWVCVWAVDRSKGVKHEEGGCVEQAGAGYQFDGFGRAAAEATIRTHGYTWTYKRGTNGRRPVVRDRPRSSATVDLTWEGAGQPSLRPWVVAPYLCYAMPPAGPACWGAGVEFSRAAVVEGTVKFRGLDLAVKVTSQDGTMKWWAGR